MEIIGALWRSYSKRNKSHEQKNLILRGTAAILKQPKLDHSSNIRLCWCTRKPNLYAPPFHTAYKQFSRLHRWTNALSYSEFLLSNVILSLYLLLHMFANYRFISAWNTCSGEKSKRETKPKPIIYYPTINIPTS